MAGPGDLRRLLLIGVFVLSAVAGRASAEDPRFASVAATVSVKPDGSMSSRRCIRGEFPIGLPVLLLSSQSSLTWAGTTGPLADPVAGAGRCTVVVGELPKDEGIHIALVGTAAADFRPIDFGILKERGRLEVLGDAVKRAGTLERLLKSAPPRALPSKPLALALDRVPTDAVELRGVPDGPVFVRYGLTHEGRHIPDGPIVAVELGQATVAVGPAGLLSRAFWLDGKAYVVAVTRCSFACGWNQMRFYVVEAGRLRLVRETTEDAL